MCLSPQPCSFPDLALGLISITSATGSTNRVTLPCSLCTLTPARPQQKQSFALCTTGSSPDPLIKQKQRACTLTQAWLMHTVLQFHVKCVYRVGQAESSRTAADLLDCLSICFYLVSSLLHETPDGMGMKQVPVLRHLGRLLQLLKRSAALFSRCRVLPCQLLCR